MDNNKKLSVVLLLSTIMGLSLIPELLFTGTSRNSPQKILISSFSESEDFSNEAHGTTGLDIDFIDEYHGYGSWYYCDQYIADGPYGNHYKVLIMRDAQGEKNTWSVHYLDNSYYIGTIEFSLWLNSGGSCTNPHYHYIKFRDSSDTIAFQLQFDLYSNKAYYHTGSAWTLIATLTKAEWYRISIDFNKDAAKYNIEIVKETTSTVVGTVTNADYLNSVAIEEVFLGTTYYHYSGNTRWDDFLFVESSDSIIIFTPESFMYDNYVHGYYPGTFGFENEEVGTSRTDIAYVDATNAIQSHCYVDIIDNFQGHNKILRIYDGNTLGNAEARNYFSSPRETGTIEWWWSTPTSGSNIIAYILHEGIIGTHAGSVSMIDGNFKDMHGNIVQSYNPNQWYHHKLVFNTISDTYDWYINGKLQVNNSNFLNPVNSIGSTNIKGAWTSTGYCYFDAIVYSWDPGYSIVENYFHDRRDYNRKEGLLIDFAPDDLEWMAYTLYGCGPIEVYGDFVIPFIPMWTNDVQIFGEDAQGNSYSSEVKAFYRNNLEVSSPEYNMIYTEPMEGYYPGSYGFENDEDGETPYGWYTREIYGNNLYEIDSELEGHNKVYQMRKKDSTSKAETSVQFESTATSGTIEFWLYKDTEAIGEWDPTRFFFIGEGGTIQFGIAQGKLYKGTFSTSPSYISGATFSKNTWHHIRVDFDITTGWHIYLDGTLYGSVYQYDFVGGAPTYIDTFIMSSIYSGDYGDYSAWLDALGYSWDPYYKVDDNIREGILLEFDPYNQVNPSNTRFITLCYDGTFYRPLLGNTVLPFYDGGPHLMTVIAEHNDGWLFMSEAIQYTNEPKGWNPINLIGSSERFFPHEETSRLGFTIYSVFVYSTPIIELSINETEPYSGIVSIKIKIDKELVWSTNIDMDYKEVFQSQFDQLSPKGTHQIVIEVSNGEGPNDIYQLEYLKVKNLYFDELLVRVKENIPFTHTPDQIHSFEVTYQTSRQIDYDEAVMAFNSIHPGDTNTGKLSAREPVFRSSVVFNIDPDTEDSGISFYENFYLHSLALQWRVLRPDGTYLSWNNGPYTCDLHPSQNAYDEIGITYDAMDILLMFIGLEAALFDLPTFYDDIITGIETTYSFLGLLLDENAEGLPQLLETAVGDDAYRAWWETGYTGITGQSPNPALEDFSLLVLWAPLLYGESTGNYQIEMTFSADIYLKVVNKQGWGYVFSNYVTTLSETQYINFELVELN